MISTRTESQPVHCCSYFRVSTGRTPHWVTAASCGKNLYYKTSWGWNKKAKLACCTFNLHLHLLEGSLENSSAVSWEDYCQWGTFICGRLWHIFCVNEHSAAGLCVFFLFFFYGDRSKEGVTQWKIVAHWLVFHHPSCLVNQPVTAELTIFPAALCSLFFFFFFEY